MRDIFIYPREGGHWASFLWELPRALPRKRGPAVRDNIDRNSDFLAGIGHAATSAPWFIEA